MFVSSHSVRDAEDGTAVPLDQQPESVLVALLGPADGGEVGHLHVGRVRLGNCHGVRKMRDLARFLMVAGIILLVTGALLALFGKLGIGRLPGDFVIRRGNFTLYFPLATSILLSIAISLLFWLFRR
jgi:hypothetical protein